MTWNEFQRELEKRNIDPQVAYCLSMIYERQIETGRIVDEMAKLLESFAGSLGKMIVMHQTDQNLIMQMRKKLGELHKTPGVDVASIANDPMDKDV